LRSDFESDIYILDSSPRGLSSMTAPISPGPASAAFDANARDRLLEEGTRLVAERGIEAINTNVIARAARVGVGTFYNHFGDKYALHRAVVGRGLEAVRGALAEAHRRTESAPIAEQVRAGVTALVDVAQSHPLRFRAAFARPTPGARRTGAVLGLSSRPVEQRLAALQREGSIDPAIDPGVAARAFTEMQLSAIASWLEDPKVAPREALIETLIRLHPAIACRIA
jgi:AcrR family transcriptional regulator